MLTNLRFLKCIFSNVGAGRLLIHFAPKKWLKISLILSYKYFSQIKDFFANNLKPNVSPQLVFELLVPQLTLRWYLIRDQPLHTYLLIGLERMHPYQSAHAQAHLRINLVAFKLARLPESVNSCLKVFNALKQNHLRKWSSFERI